VVYCGLVDDEDRKEWCGKNGLPKNWGWTNRINTTDTCIIGTGKGGCDESAGYDTYVVLSLFEDFSLQAKA
jgi:hypothetical protein